MEWSDEYLPNCPGCKDIYGNRSPPEEPPCDTCRVELSADNQKVAAVYMMCRHQYVTAEEGRIVGLSIPAIKIMMDLNEVKNQKECLERVIRMFYLFANKKQDK